MFWQWSPLRMHKARYADLPGGLVRAEWTTPIEGWQAHDGRFIFTRGQAIWNLPDGPLDYLDFTMAPGDIQYNVAPADIASRLS